MPRPVPESRCVAVPPFLELCTMIGKKKLGDMQDGILAHYLSQAAASDSNVEPRLDREYFDYRNMMRKRKRQTTSSLAGFVSTDRGPSGAS
jgi:hypothetical protein